ncbi:MAG: helix-turn-helix domain-containing protein [Proteobacteria bacterium]|nr:helix-turn-helix domain-containing protein [Pseudomonadota bacterium]
MPKHRDPVDLHVGLRLRLRRNMLGLSQDKLGSAIGVSFQMVQKYERGDCRVGASRLMKIAQSLDVPVSWFFEGFAGKDAKSMRVAEDKATLDEGMLHSKETMDLLKAYYTLPEKLRRNVLTMMKTMQDDKNGKDDEGA